MPIESATYINGLDVTNPVVGDPLGHADDHLRLLKSVLKATFPNVSGAVSATHTDLSSIATLTTRVTTVEGNRLRKDADDTTTGSITISGSGKFLDAPTVKQGGHALLPAGCIVMWAGTAATVPAGWGLCDGTGGRPDLRGLFVVGAGPSTPEHSTGGSTTLSTATAAGGNHSHGGATAAAGDHTHSGITDNTGSHSHGGSVGLTALTVDQMPAHGHQQFVGQGGGGGDTAWNISNTGTPSGTSLNTGTTGGGQGHSHSVSADGGHVHALSVAGVSAHTHVVSSSGDHTHSVTVTGHRPPYYALAFIQKL